MSKERKVLVASSVDITATTPQTTSGEMNCLVRSPDGTLAALPTGATINAYPTLIFSVGKGTGYAPDMYEIKGKDLIKATSTAFSLGVAKNAISGYVGSGTNTAPVNLYSSYEYAIRVMVVDTENTDAKFEPSGKYFPHISAYNTPSAAHGRYNVLKALVNDINVEDMGVRAYIRQSETLTAMTVNCTMVSGSAVVTSASHGLSAGVFVQLGFSFYKVLSVTTNTFTLDRVYEGPSETIQYNQALGGNATVVNGSTSVSATAHGAVVGDYVNLGNVVYKVVVKTSANAFVIDRPYEGTGVVLTAGAVPGSAAATLGSGGYVAGATVDDATYFGLHFQADEVDKDFTVSFEQGFDGGEQDTVEYSTMSYSIGEGAEVVAEEAGADPSFGVLETTGVSPDSRTHIAAATSNYNKWCFTNNNSQPSNMSTTHNNEQELVLYILDGASTMTNFYTYLNAWVNDSGAENGLNNVT